MRTVVLGPPPPELAALIERRRQLGLDQYDEVWDGEYHMAPMAHSRHGRIQAELAWLLRRWSGAADLLITGPFNLGQPGDFRVPDLGLHRSDPDALWVPTAAIVVEVESPDDETWEKLPFYAARQVEEVMVVSPEGRSVTWLIRQDGAYQQSAASRLLGPDPGNLPDLISW